MDLFTAEIFTKGILPFLLVFVLVFAILQKSKILGEGKAQVDALVALAIGLILIGVPTPRGYIVSMVPWLAVALVALLVFMLIYGFVGESDAGKGLKVPTWVRQVAGFGALIFVIILVLVVTGYWDNFKNWISSSSVLGNIILIVVVIVVLWVAIAPKFEEKHYSING